MTVEELERAQGHSLPADDLKPYAGQWVAIRDGHVIASDLSAVGLRAQADVREDDLLALVPAGNDSVFIL